jgi:hypothetical protein
MRQITCLLSTLALVLVFETRASADPYYFTTGNPDGRLAAASRPQIEDKVEIESADDFILSARTVLYYATFTGLLPAEAEVRDIDQVRVEIYRVFPNDSDTNRTPNVPTRVNSPADVEFAEQDRSTADGNLSYTIRLLQPEYTVANSVVDGIFPSPHENTGGEGPVTGQLVQFAVLFVVPLDLPADHYFFVPQVALKRHRGNFLWASAAHPQFTGDLQTWIRNSNLDPDWLRVGKDIVGGTTFNACFSLAGETVNE